ncbi:MAG: DNA mismatch repair protein MutS [Alphaproteobacteria bacterium]|nr:DNA mismatch repair protein MutS [Alphaproteobacteria bacterium]MBT5860699.1 DNA mismatch repair protein MutS [Alphaproteobacteria bacterium]
MTLWRETIGEGQTAGDAAVSGQSSPLPPIPSANTPKGKSSGPNPGGLGKHEARAIKRGRLPIDDRIDLHGMTQDLARDALSGFIRNSAAQGLKCVLVITGKGSPRQEPDDALFMARRPGVLRNAVPGWLSGAELGRYVIGFQPALPRDGGGGALYVLLRRG